MAVVRLHLQLLGGFTVRSPDGHVIKLSNRRNQALLGFLALDPGRRHARDKLVELLWGERASDRGRNSLRQGLAVLRKELADAAPALTVVDGDGELLFVPPGVAEVDVLAFERLARSDSAPDLRAAAALYEGELLADFGLREPGFEEWLGLERSRLRDLAIDVLFRLVLLLAGPEAIETARRLVALDPLRDGSQSLLIRLMAEQGQTELALKQYRGFRAILEDELGIEPSEATQALIRDIVSGRIRNPTEPENPVVPQLDHRLEERVRIAVLPFENRSANPEHQGFCNALTDDVADAISRVSTLQVISGPVTARYRDRRIDVRAVGSALDVAHVLQGSVHRQNDRMRISVQVSDVVSGHHVWVEQYDGAVREVFEIQETIIRAIAASAETHIMLAVRDLATRDAAQGSYDAMVQRGISLLYDETPEALDEILEIGERAVALAPRDLRANLLLAEAVVQRLAQRVDAFDPAIVKRGVALARTAVGMAPDNEWLHLLLARAHIEAGELEAAIADSERALEINPSSTVAFSRLGECKALLGRSDEALAATQMALQLDPRGPETYRRYFAIALAHFAAGDDAEALKEAARAALWRPDFTRASILVAAAATALGRKAESDAAIIRCLERYPDLRAGDVAPRTMPPFARAADRDRLTALLRNAGLPE